MKTLFITFSVLAVIEITITSVVGMLLIYDGIKRIQAKLHTWSNTINNG